MVMLLCQNAASQTLVQIQSTAASGSQTVPTPTVKPTSGALRDSGITYVFLAIGGFIPTSQSYRLNFANSFVGLPVELSGGLLFPIAHDVFVPFTVRYEHRTANFVTGMSMAVTTIEPGVRYFFQREDPSPSGSAMIHELRIFGAIEGLLAEASIAGSYDVSSDGTVTGTAQAQRSYFNVGIGIDLGLMYPLTPISALEVSVHFANFFANPISDGGLGNIGGVSISGAYRIGF